MDDGAWGSVAGHFAFCLLPSAFATGWGRNRLAIMWGGFDMALGGLCPAFHVEARPKPIRNLNPSAPFPPPRGALPLVWYHPGPPQYP
jgi:hypothetical protein